MRPGPEQLPLPIEHPPRYGRADFIEAPTNAAALAFIDRWPDWPAPLAVLTGPEGTGKSHLARIFAERSGATSLEASLLDEAHVVSLVPGASLVLENCDRGGLDERSLFHLINRIRAEGGQLLLTAQRAPDLWGLTLPDLISRLRAAPLLLLAEPDDDLLRSLFVKLFRDRQMQVDPAVVAYAIMRLERSCAAVRAFVERLDLAALAQQRPISRMVVAELLSGGEDESA